MINSINVDNFRSLCDIKDIEIKPMTVLLGKNSSGKSSFLRIFPLLKQSVNNKIRGTISLFGDLVDFGEFDTVLNDVFKNGKKYISFSFTGIIPKSRTPVIIGHDRRRIQSRKIDYSLKINIKKYEEEDYLYISDIQLKYDKNTIEISLNIKDMKISKFLINGVSFVEKYPMLRVGYFFYTSFFPEFVMEDDKNTFLGNPDTEILNNIFKKGFRNILSELEIFRIIHELNYGDDKKSIMKQLEKYLAPENERLSFLGKKVEIEPDTINEIEDALQFRDFLTIYELLEENLCSAFSNICYSKPLRANTERFYRNQPLAVNEVEPDGSNLVQFYSTMSTKQKNDFHSWMDKNFDFHYELEKQIGFQSIVIKDALTNEKHNINDMGFGFTQILPIVTQEWSLINKNNTSKGRDTIFAIEQPELHLHPAFQCKLIKAFANSIKIAAKNNLSIRFIIETHSETIVNYLGKLIERKEMNNDDVSVLIFTKENSITKISESTYNENGVLNNWPIGFFGE